MHVRKLKRGPVSESDGAAGARRLVGARPVEHGYGSYFGSVKEKSKRSWGSRGLAPLGCFPPLGERGGHPHKFYASLKKTPGDFSRAKFFTF
jgi:hypothetical protein